MDRRKFLGLFAALPFAAKTVAAAVEAEQEAHRLRVVDCARSAGKTSAQLEAYGRAVEQGFQEAADEPTYTLELRTIDHFGVERVETFAGCRSTIPPEARYVQPVFTFDNDADVVHLHHVDAAPWGVRGSDLVDFRTSRPPALVKR